MSHGGGGVQQRIHELDNILLSWVVIVQVISLEGWSDVMFAANQIDGSWNQLYFVTLVMVRTWKPL